jgi:hypothetical protein
VQSTAEGVVLDLNGFAVIGPVACTGLPVTSCAPASTATGISTTRYSQVHGGTVRGFGTGVVAGSDSRLWNLVVAHNDGVGVRLSDGAALHNSTVVANRTDGVAAGTGAGFGEVAGSTIRGNGDRGVQMCGGLALNNRMQNNGSHGFHSGCVAGDAGYALNVLRENNSDGAQVLGGRAIGCNVIAGAAVCPTHP